MRILSKFLKILKISCKFFKKSLKDEEGNSAFDVCEDTEIASILNVNRYYGEIVNKTILLHKA